MYIFDNLIEILYFLDNIFCEYCNIVSFKYDRYNKNSSNITYHT